MMFGLSPFSYKFITFKYKKTCDNRSSKFGNRRSKVTYLHNIRKLIIPQLIN